MVSNRSNGINWSFIAALAGLACLISVFGFGVYIGFLADSPENQQQRVISAYHSGDNPQQRPQQYLTARSGIPAFVEAIISHPQPTTGQDHEKRDLAAQEASATFGWWMVVVSLLGFCVTFVGTILLYQQIRLTREAVKDTGDATKAMNVANEIARETAHAQIRAYLMVESVVMRVTNGGINCDVIVRNVGESPATKVIVEVWIGAIISGIIKESDEFEFSQGNGEKRPQGFGAVPKGAHVSLDFAGWGQKDLGIDFKKYIGVRDQPARQLSVNATLHGTLRWEDVFNQTHCLGFNAYCYKLEKILLNDRMLRANGSITHNPIEA